MMKVFISWSGESSKSLAETLRSWLPAVLQALDPYFTPSDLEKGSRWSLEIAKELETAEAGILCITRENLHSDWILFEAGALSKSLGKNYVCPVLFGIQNTDLSGPLRQFQTTEFCKEDFEKLVTVINGKLGDSKLKPNVLKSVFEKWWPDLEGQVNTILGEQGDHSTEPIRSDRELIEEILTNSRIIIGMRRRTTIPNLAAMKEILENYIALHHTQVEGQGGYQDTLDLLENMKKPILYISRFFSSDKEIETSLSELEKLNFLQEEKEEEISKDDIPF